MKGVFIQCFCITAWVMVVACQGRLTERQRDTMREIIQSKEIRRIPEATITERAFEYGRNLYANIEFLGDDQEKYALIDALNTHHDITIRFFCLEDSTSLPKIETELLKAYETVSIKDGSSYDDVQYLPDDLILYTKPSIKKDLNGNDIIEYVVGIYMPKKEVVLSMNQNRPAEAR